MSAPYAMVQCHKQADSVNGRLGSDELTKIADTANIVVAMGADVRLGFDL